MPKVAVYRLAWSGTDQTYHLQETRDQALLDITPESLAWFTWLDLVSSFAFWGKCGHYTARKERRPRGEAYWYAYVGIGKKLTKKYLGKTSDVTLARLEQVAAVLAGQASLEDASQTKHEPGAAALQLLDAPRVGQHRSLPTPTNRSAHPPEPEHRPSSRRGFPTGTMTLLFTDIEGSTQLLQRLGERYAHVLTECRDVLHTMFVQYNGFEVDTQGDAFFVVFARATDAVSAAVAAQRALASRIFPEDVMVRVRMGLHTGEPERTAEGYVGLDVHRAARIMSAAHGGQVLLSRTTANLVEQDLPEDLSLRDLGEHRLKDQGRPWRLFQLVISDVLADFPPLRTLDTYPNNLPTQHTPFIGREQELTAVGQLISREEVRLVTLTGPGGTGKTRLGVQVAAELTDAFADGVFFVNLAPVSDPALVVPTIAETLGIQEAGGRPLRERLKEEVQRKQMLLLLDNFEQVVSAAVQVVDLLSTCPRLKVLVTSREALHVRAEQEFTVPPFPLPVLKHLPDLAVLSHNAAVALFVSRAQAVKPGFQVTNANARAIVEICARLDGLPLAIELAAARMKLFPPQALLARLSQRLTVLTSGARDAPARQQTLRNTIAWSYHLLNAEEQQLFRQLSVFVGGCTLEAVEAVCQDMTASVLDVVASLIDKSLLQQTGQEGEEPRLMMLETIREYGLERLVVSREEEATRGAHVDYYLALAEMAEPELAGPQQGIWLERLEREHDNLRAALRWSLEQGETEESRERTLRLNGALGEFWFMRGHMSEGRNSLERALAASEGVVTLGRAKALDSAGLLALYQGDNDQAETHYQERLTLCRKLGDAVGIAGSLRGLGAIARNRGNVIEARSLFEESLALYRKIGNKADIPGLLFLLANLLTDQGEFTNGHALFEESLALSRERGDKSSIASTLNSIARLIFLSLGDPVTTRSLIEEGLTLFKEVGFREGIAASLGLLGQIALSQGDTATAHLLAEEILEHCKEFGNRAGTAESHALLGKVAFVQGDYTAACAMFKESLAIAREGNYKDLIVSGLEGLASVVAAQRELTWAARLWGAAECLRETIGARIPPVERADYERWVTAARTQLGEKAFAAAWAEGRAMTPEQALAAREPATMPMLVPMEQPSPSPAKPVATYPDGLTAREVEVLRCVAKGWSDAQVADKLVISPRTVNSHLTSIYNKLGVDSRAAATRFAVEHQLA